MKRQDGACGGAIRVWESEIDGQGMAPRLRGLGRDVLVRTKGPFLLRNQLIPADGADGPRPGCPGGVGRLGDDP